MGPGEARAPPGRLLDHGSLIPAALVAVGLATPNSSLWEMTLALVGPFTVGGAFAASGTLALARKAENPEKLGAGS